LVEKAVFAFAKAADRQDASALEQLLDDHFRIVMNQLFGNPGVAVMDKAAYLEKIRSKEFGGEKRETRVEGIFMNSKTASAKVVFKGEQMTIVSLLHLVQTREGSWKIIADLPALL